MLVAVLGRLRVIGLVVVVVVLAVDGMARLDGQDEARRLATVVALLVTCGAIALLGVAAADGAVRRPADSVVVVLAVVVAGSATLLYLSPSGAGVLAAFVAARASAGSLPSRTSLVVTGATMAAVAVATLLSPRPSLADLAVREAGVLAFHGLGLYLRRLRERAAEAAVTAERQRVAREMHDVLAHSLSGLAVHLEVARVLAAREQTSPELREAVGRAGQLARTGLQEARSAIGMLRDEPTPGPGQLPRLAEQFERTTGRPCSVTITGADVTLAPAARLAIYRATQEALTNAARHAEPERVDVRLESAGGGALLRVEDQSTTRPDPGFADRGYGLTGMRERAELLGGRLTAGPTPTGFLVELWLPAS